MLPVCLVIATESPNPTHLQVGWRINPVSYMNLFTLAKSTAQKMTVLQKLISEQSLLVQQMSAR
jgi:hypothetical protein